MHDNNRPTHPHLGAGELQEDAVEPEVKLVALQPVHAHYKVHPGPPAPLRLGKQVEKVRLDLPRLPGRRGFGLPGEHPPCHLQSSLPGTRLDKEHTGRGLRIRRLSAIQEKRDLQAAAYPPGHRRLAHGIGDVCDRLEPGRVRGDDTLSHEAQRGFVRPRGKELDHARVDDGRGTEPLPGGGQPGVEE